MRQKIQIATPNTNGWLRIAAAKFTNEPFVCHLQSHGREENYEELLAIGAYDKIGAKEPGIAFDQLRQKLSHTRDWWFGYFSYDLKNELEELHSRNLSVVDFPSLAFFNPRWIITLSKGKLTLHYFEDDFPNWIEEIKLSPNSNSGNTENSNSDFAAFSLEPGLSRSGYINSVNKLLEHIHRGDIYEANFCWELSAAGHIQNPYELYTRLAQRTEAPFSAYLHMGPCHALSASPERFLKKNDAQLISQPIKGTAPRGQDDVQDRLLAENLSRDPKERAENTMIVDLVRNDLSKVAARGSVKVDEFCAIHSFRTVHQMISTISATLKPNYTGLDAIMAAFPMGSMTGAPKIRAMELIEEIENFKRGLYSGAIGYFDPEDNFDFSVVIRTIFYNESTEKISCAVGSAITSQCLPEKEYDECLLKAQALLQILGTEISIHARSV